MPNQAYDMSQYWRIFSYQHGRVDGTFVVYTSKAGPHNVRPYEVVILPDETYMGGRILYGPDFTAFVKDGTVSIPKHMIRESVLPDVEDAWDDMIAAIEACVAAFPTEQEESVRREAIGEPCYLPHEPPNASLKHSIPHFHPKIRQR